MQWCRLTSYSIVLQHISVWYTSISKYTQGVMIPDAVNLYIQVYTLVGNIYLYIHVVCLCHDIIWYLDINMYIQRHSMISYSIGYQGFLMIYKYTQVYPWCGDSSLRCSAHIRTGSQTYENQRSKQILLAAVVCTNAFSLLTYQWNPESDQFFFHFWEGIRVKRNYCHYCYYCYYTYFSNCDNSNDENKSSR